MATQTAGCCLVQKLQNQLLKQLSERFFGIVAQTRMNGRRLHDGASGGREPAETTRNGQLANGATFFTPRTNSLEGKQTFL